MSTPAPNPNVEAIYPLTPGQEGMLFHAIDAPGGDAYFQQYVCTLRGALDADLFKRAWQRVLARHGALRTQFTWEKRERPLQIVRQTLDVPLTMEEWTPEEAEARLQAYLRDDRARGFDLGKAPLMRLLLARAGDAHTLVWSWHHLLMDGWSTYAALREVFACYDALRNGRDWSPAAPRPFREFVQWLQARDASGDEPFWRGELAGIGGPTTLAAAVRAPRPAGRGHAQTVRVCDDALTQALKAFAQRQRVTLNTVLQAAWALVLNRYCASDDLIFGVTQSGRPASLPGAESMLGMFIASAPLRARVRPDDRVSAWLAELQTTAARIREFEHTPLARIQHWAGLTPGGALFDSLLVFENYPMDGALAPESSGLRIEAARHIEQSNYPLAVIVVPAPTLQLFAVYDRAHFDAPVVERLLRHLRNALDALRHAETVGEVDLLDDDERAQVCDGFNATARPWPQDALAHELIAAQPAGAIAAVYRDSALSYGELDARATALAAALLARGVRPGDPVALCAERSLEMLVGIVGILKAGGAYVPLDPAYPRERIDFMLADSGARVTVLARGAADAGAWPTPTVVVDASAPFEASVFAGPSMTSDSLAYIIYTSGSTGQPKGVPVKHRHLVHSTLARAGVYEQAPGRFLLLSSFSFDSSVVGLFWTLCSGGTLILPEQKQEQDMGALAGLIGRHGVTHMLALPSLYRLVLDFAERAALATLRCVIVAGEACTADLAQRHYAQLPAAALYNEYGPTEGTVWSTACRIPADFSGGIVPIGRPIPNMRNVVLDARRRPQPVGVSGELYIGGAGVVEGYWRRPELSAERFVPLTLNGAPAQAWYRTGDLARWLPDGTLEFLGRADNQIKLRGYRVELEEIEGALNTHPSVRESVVVLRQTARGGAELDALESALQAMDPDARARLLTDIENLPA